MKFFARQFFKFHVWLYRVTGGRLGSRMGGFDILLLTTIGRKSGKTRTLPVTYLRDGDSYYIVGNANGSPKHPGWYWNATQGTAPVVIQVRDQQMQVAVEDLQGEERLHYKQQIEDTLGGFDEREQRAGRALPILKLTPLTDVKHEI